MSAPVLHQAPPPFAVRSGRWLVIRHLLTTAVTVLAMMALWALLSAPFVALFIIDDEFSTSEYAGAALWVSGVVGVATLAMTPVAVGLERLVLRGGRAWTVMAALLPIALVVAIAVCVVAAFKVIESDTAYGAVAIAVLLMVVLVIYWPTLWTLNLASYVLRRARHTQRLQRTQWGG
ncbi:hypothetical protein AB0M36_12590 [Actinoplanes sp. NPDC051346]|uniref:hypothetical protein n=1 Tax=Actinoplanes sp. NPDC051346 TaxID=3155048 RepID=UPI0034403D4F